MTKHDLANFEDLLCKTEKFILIMLKFQLFIILLGLKNSFYFRNFTKLFMTTKTPFKNNH